MGLRWKTAEEKTESIRVAHEALVSPPPCCALQPAPLLGWCQHTDACVQEASYAAGGFHTYSFGFPEMTDMFPDLEQERGLVIELLSQLFDPNPQKRLKPREILGSPLLHKLSSL